MVRPLAKAPAAVTPPEGATLVVHGRLVLGYKHDPHPRQRLTPLQARAAVRLRHLDALGRRRARYGLLLDDPAGWLAVVTDCLAELAGVGSWRLTARAVLRFVPELDRPAITPDLIAAAMDARRRSGRLISNHEAGALVGLVDDERQELEAEGIVLTLHPVNETEEARAERRIARRRAMTAARNREMRERHKAARANSVTPRNVTSNGLKVTFGAVTQPLSIMERHAGNVTLRSGKGPAAVMAAIAAGHSSIPAIACQTGFSASRVKMSLRRLLDAGRIVKTGRGRYGAAPGRIASPRGARSDAESLALIAANIRTVAARIAISASPLNAMAARIGAALPVMPCKLENCNGAPPHA